MAAARMGRIGRETFRRLASQYAKQLEAEEAHALSTTRTWRGISLLVAIPVCGYLFYKHVLTGDSHGEGKEYTPWSHLRIRNKPFPWGDGDTTLFHNPHTNVGPPKAEQLDSDGESTTQVHWITQWMWDNLTEDFEQREQRRNDYLQSAKSRADAYMAVKKGRVESMYGRMHGNLSQVEGRKKSPDQGMHGY
eukprot:m.20214 g.20214  ORF g.20214 m.20214 type:complete len:192 (+) comp27990_c0_seq4:97-672(+)